MKGRDPGNEVDPQVRVGACDKGGDRVATPGLRRGANTPTAEFHHDFIAKIDPNERGLSHVYFVKANSK